MNKDEVLILKPQFPVKPEVMCDIHKQIIEQMETGVILLPFGYEVAVKPKQIEIELGPSKDEDKVIHNAVTYICMADRNNRGAEANDIAKVLYDRAYRKGFEAGKIEGKKEGKVKIKTVYEPVRPDEDWGEFKG